MVPVWNAGKPRRQDGNESRREGGQAPNQASSGRQTGAAAHARTDHSQGTHTAASHPTSHTRHGDNQACNDPDGTTARVLPSPDARARRPCGSLLRRSADARSPRALQECPRTRAYSPRRHAAIVERGLQFATAQRATPGSSYPLSVAKGTNASLSRVLSTSRSSSGSPRTNIAKGPATSMTHCS